MAYINCIVASCDTQRKPTDKNTVKCFSLPKDPALKNEWLNICKVSKFDQTKDCYRKVCIKHFKEDDFVDGLKARLLNLEPTRLKKNAVPSLFLNGLPDNTDMKKQEKSIRYRKKSKYTNSSNNIARSAEYLSTLVPIAPKRPIINPAKTESTISTEKKPFEKKQSIKHSDQHSDLKQLKKEISSPHLIQQRLKILQHDNAIYKKRISILLENQNKLLARIKDLEDEIKNGKENFDATMKSALANTLTPNQIDVIMGKKDNVWWSDVEYIKAHTLQNLSKQAYYYVKDILNYPLPSFAALQQWLLKIDGTIENCNDIKPSVTFQCDISGDENDTQDTMEVNDTVVNDVTNSNFNDGNIDLGNEHVQYKIETKNEVYELPYDNKCENNTEEPDNIEYNEGYISNNDFYETDGETDEFYEELVIENSSDNDRIDNRSSGASIQEENG